MIEDLIIAHKFSSGHKQQILKDNTCGCFYCLKIFSPQQIVIWLDDEIDATALCPYCTIDSVIGESSGFPVTPEFLARMRKHWFD